MYKMPPRAVAKNKKDPKKAPKLKMAKGGMVKCPKCGKTKPCMACGGMVKKGKK